MVLKWNETHFVGSEGKMVVRESGVFGILLIFHIIIR
jgi:hypothetical protein